MRVMITKHVIIMKLLNKGALKNDLLVIIL